MYLSCHEICIMFPPNCPEVWLNVNGSLSFFSLSVTVITGGSYMLDEAIVCFLITRKLTFSWATKLCKVEKKECLNE